MAKEKLDYFALLRLLGNGQFHSGEDIAKQIAVSRANVWHYINELDKLDLFDTPILRVRGRGYQLPYPIDWLDADKIQQTLITQGVLFPFQIQVFNQLPSTNTYLMQTHQTHSGHVILTEWQTEGRGRRGKQWQAKIGGSLTFSLLWRFEQDAQRLAGLSLVIGIALVRALSHFSIPVQLKWPNDLIVNYQKLGGILIELKGDLSGPCDAVIGIGLNIDLPRSLYETVDQPIIDLKKLTTALPTRNDIVATILSELAVILPQFAQAGFAPFQEEWLTYHAYTHRPVRLITTREEEKIVVIEGISDTGALIIRHQDTQKSETLFSGEVSLRPVAESSSLQ